MIQSMTGFGRDKQVFGAREITVEVKAVNHRYLEVTTRLPRTLGFLEERLKGLVQQRIHRGKVEVAVSLAEQRGPAARVVLNRELAASYLAELRAFGQEQGLADDLSLSGLLRVGELFTQVAEDIDEEELARQVLETASGALDGFMQMRRREGERLAADLGGKLERVLELVAKAEARSPETVAAYHDRLYRKLAELLGDRQIDEGRLITEAALFADKVAVDEETVRLRSHAAAFAQALDGDEPAGRRLDFLTQEMNREANTIGSKAQDAAMARLVVELKSELEKIREQIQNIE